VLGAYICLEQQCKHGTVARPHRGNQANSTPAQEALGSDVVGHDASGNPILKDIGTYLRDNIKKHISVRVHTTQCSSMILSQREHRRSRCTDLKS